MFKREAKSVADCLVVVICRFGVFDQLLSDQGRNFQAELISELFELLYHSIPSNLRRSNGVAMKGAYVEDKQQLWDVNLNQLAFAYNTSEQRKHHLS